MKPTRPSICHSGGGGGGGGTETVSFRVPSFTSTHSYHRHSGAPAETVGGGGGVLRTDIYRIKIRLSKYPNLGPT